MEIDLETTLVEKFRMTPRQVAALRKLGIRTLRDLLFHFPVRYEELGETRKISDLVPGEKARIVAEIVGIKAQKTWKKKLRIAEGVARDETGLLGLVWFHQPYIANILKPGMRVRLSGKVTKRGASLVLVNPLHEPAEPSGEATPAAGTLTPIYQETYGITSRWLRYQIERILKSLGALPETLPQDILGRYHLPSFDRSLRAIHFPKKPGDAEGARKRFAFEEVLLIQLERQRERQRLEGERAFAIPQNSDLLSRFVASLPFSLTNAQARAIEAILGDLAKPHPTGRLLEGDVGSGKTLVAAAAALATVSAGFQVAYMAPTEILARQHLAEFTRRLGPFRVRIGLLTAAEAKKFPSKVNPRDATHIAKSQLLRWCASGEIQILIGTHALIEDRVKFKKLALAIVDEQHRFGTRQRGALRKKAEPHFLSMSATPIPRTLALTIYGDLDLTVLDEMPPGRTPVETRIVAPRERERIYDFIRREIADGGQVFIICPRIDDPKEAKRGPIANNQLPMPNDSRRSDWDDVKSVKVEFKKLSAEVFPDLKIGMVHGKLKPKEKEAVMHKFKNRELDILVSTSVVEVGVDIPNASIMLIEGGERFGLATLHQFRGRVGRGDRKSYCFVFTTDDASANSRRLRALLEAKTGFELAEADLEFRGPGELSGAKQWGISDVGMEALKNLKMVEAARAEAQALVAADPEFSRHPLLKQRLNERGGAIHLE